MARSTRALRPAHHLLQSLRSICFSPFLYKARNLIERLFNKAKQFRRIAARYDKLTENYLAALKLVATRIWLRDNESTS